MREIKLFSQGQFVSKHFVPPFMAGHMPDVVNWGIRFFKRSETDETHYEECFCYCIPTFN